MNSLHLAKLKPEAVILPPHHGGKITHLDLGARWKQIQILSLYTENPKRQYRPSEL